MARMALLVSPELCIGCRGCQSACKEWNGLPAVKTVNRGTFENPPDLTGADYNRIRFMEVPSAQDAQRWLFVSQRCMHCGDAACMKICPSSGALFRAKNGAVVFDKGKCIGCKLCGSACPYGLIRFDQANKVSKCHLCHDRTEAGLTPACVKTCPSGALKYGDRDKLAAEASAAGYSNLYGEADLGGTGVLYAFKDSPKVYGMLQNPAFPAEVHFWSGIKSLAYLGLGATVAASALHYLVIGPHKEEGEEVKKDE